ncbi:hypothetical protein SpCBS45565_g06091 [Spizellomyces sp. 'palustris']|nr:hypothetical protein SpCBS45565_g06091 [Spizellomyces sp. 'palustris']
MSFDMTESFGSKRRLGFGGLRKKRMSIPDNLFPETAVQPSIPKAIPNTPSLPTPPKPYNTALHAVTNGNIPVAFRTFASLPQHAPSQYALGVLYTQGLTPDHEPNHTLAAHYYTLAAEQGYAPAQCNLGVSYAAGVGVPRDMSKAVEWLRRAAGKGHGEAMCNLGRILWEGVGVRPDVAEARRWFERAAVRGVEVARVCLQVLDEEERRDG